jgi:hypothetical protein
MNREKNSGSFIPIFVTLIPFMIPIPITIDTIAIILIIVLPLIPQCKMIRINSFNNRINSMQIPPSAMDIQIPFSDITSIPTMEMEMEVAHS